MLLRQAPRISTSPALCAFGLTMRTARSAGFHVRSSRSASTAAQSSSSPAAPGSPDPAKPKSLTEINETPDQRRNDIFRPDKYYLSDSWTHPDFEMSEMKTVPVAHREPSNFADRMALRGLQWVRWSFDFATGYKHPPAGHETDPKYALTPQQWLQRFVFLESIAGVPGMVGGMVRHLHSLRLLRRDRAWIETLLEEAYNERMHLLTFIKLTKPGIVMRVMLLFAQGIFFNSFFVAYLLAPRICHRFVGYLEEEAVVTYTRCIDELEKGLNPEWASTPAPDIAKNYWNMADDATVKDLLYYVRADECKHREVNHTLANLKQNVDRNPYALKLSDKPQPTKDLKHHHKHPVGWERDEIAG